MYSIIDLLKDMRGANKAKLTKLALTHPKFGCDTRGEFIDMVLVAQVKSGISEGVLGDNIAGLDEIIQLAGAWRSACRRAERINPKIYYHEKPQEHCYRCDYNWFSRGGKPKVCPRCHSAKWETFRGAHELGRKPRFG